MAVVTFLRQREKHKIIIKKKDLCIYLFFTVEVAQDGKFAFASPGREEGRPFP